MIHAPKTTRVVGAIALFSLAAALVAVATMTACDNQKGTYVYRGRLYNPAQKCLDPTRALDIIEIEREPALCAPACLVQNKTYDGGTAVYVSDVCPPYPPEFDTSGSHPLCPEAVLAFDNRRTCGLDGGPDPEPDAQVADTGAQDASDADSPPSDASDSGSSDAGTSDAGSSDASTDGSDGGT